MESTTAFSPGRLRTVLRDRRGSATIEYALLAAVIACVSVAGVAPFGTAIAQEISAISRDWSSPNEAPGCRRVEWKDSKVNHFALKAASVDRGGR